MKHTPEPWEVVDNPSGNTSIVNSTGKKTICNVVHEREDADRIVACVNGCKGIPDPVITISLMMRTCREMEYCEKLLSGLFRHVILDGQYEEAVGKEIDVLRDLLSKIVIESEAYLERTHS